MSLWQDVRFGARVLVKDKWFTLAAATALALGIGANSLVFTMVNAVLIRSLPFRNPDRVVSVLSRDARNRNQGVSFLDFQDYASQARSFSHVGLIYSAAFSVSGSAHPRCPRDGCRADRGRPHSGARGVGG